jgi:hypothetical protein
VLTNSPWSYTDRMMTYLLGEGMPEYPSWRHFFEFVICSAKKPSWFQDGRPLMERDGESLRPVRGSLERGKAYEGGNLEEFERLIDAPGSSVLYVGDHIYGDILRSKKETSWYTAMIIQELGDEVAAYESSSVDHKRQRDLEEQREALEDELRFFQARFKELTRGGAEGTNDPERLRVKRALDRVRGELRANLAEADVRGERISSQFHTYWGSLLKEQGEMSSFGLQVDLYADIHMRRVSSLRAYSPQPFFRSPYDQMPHEL